jgi:N-acyl-L-homoserine lactone synthetase
MGIHESIWELSRYTVPYGVSGREASHAFGHLHDLVKHLLILVLPFHVILHP